MLALKRKLFPESQSDRNHRSNGKNTTKLLFSGVDSLAVCDSLSERQRNDIATRIRRGKRHREGKDEINKNSSVLMNLKTKSKSSHRFQKSQKASKEPNTTATETLDSLASIYPAASRKASMQPRIVKESVLATIGSSTSGSVKTMRGTSQQIKEVIPSSGKKASKRVVGRKLRRNKRSRDNARLQRPVLLQGGLVAYLGLCFPLKPQTSSSSSSFAVNLRRDSHESKRAVGATKKASSQQKNGRGVASQRSKSDQIALSHWNARKSAARIPTAKVGSPGRNTKAKESKDQQPETFLQPFRSHGMATRSTRTLVENCKDNHESKTDHGTVKRNAIMSRRLRNRNESMKEWPSHSISISASSTTRNEDRLDTPRVILQRADTTISPSETRQQQRKRSVTPSTVEMMRVAGDHSVPQLIDREDTQVAGVCMSEEILAHTMVIDTQVAGVCMSEEIIAHKMVIDAPVDREPKNSQQHTDQCLRESTTESSWTIPSDEVKFDVGQSNVRRNGNHASVEKADTETKLYYSDSDGENFLATQQSHPHITVTGQNCVALNETNGKSLEPVVQSAASSESLVNEAVKRSVSLVLDVESPSPYSLDLALRRSMNVNAAMKVSPAIDANKENSCPGLPRYLTRKRKFEATAQENLRLPRGRFVSEKIQGDTKKEQTKHVRKTPWPLDKSSTNALRRSRRNTAVPDRFGTFANIDDKQSIDEAASRGTVASEGVDANPKEKNSRPHTIISCREHHEKFPRLDNRNTDKKSSGLARKDPSSSNASSVLMQSFCSEPAEPYPQWTNEEILMLRNAHKEADPKSYSFWDDIADKLKTRSSSECREKWFDLAMTPDVRARKKASKQLDGDLEATTLLDPDDIFNSTPMRTLFSSDLTGALQDDLGPIGYCSAIKLADSRRIQMKSGINSKGGYKTYIRGIKRDINKRARKQSTGVKEATRYPRMLTARANEGDAAMNGRLSPGGTLKVFVSSGYEEHAEVNSDGSDYDSSVDENV